MRRITKAALGGLAGCALVLGATQVASGTAVIKQYLDHLSLTDLLPPPAVDPADVDPADVDPADKAFDHAIASVRIMKTPDGTGFKLRVEGIDTSVGGQAFGAHLHVGPCPVATNIVQDTTGGHYQNVPSGGANPENEVWFNLVPSDNGVATDDTFVSFKPVAADSAMSIVIHHHATDATGKAGPKEACLPVEGVFQPAKSP